MILNNIFLLRIFCQKSYLISLDYSWHTLFKYNNNKRKPPSTTSTHAGSRDSLQYLLMSESRVGELLRHSRSRHEVIASRELRKASVDYRRQRREARQANEDVRKLLSEMRYFQALDHRLAKGVSSKRKELNGVQSIRERYLGDQRRKEMLEKLRQQEIRKNQALNNKVKEDRSRRIEAVLRSQHQRDQLADYYRSEKSRLMDERASEYDVEMSKNRSRVETIVEFECNLRESYVRKKERQNSRFISVYRDAIEQDRQTVQMKRTQTEEIKQKLHSLTEGTARKLTKLQELIGSIKKFKPSTPSHPLINKDKLLEKSRCYTETSSVYEKPNAHDDYVFMSRQATDS